MSKLAIFGPPVRGRSCGSCKACCTQVPVVLPDEHKAANVRCKHLCSRGCSIYDHRPRPCRAWSCRWLFDADTAGLRRPDLSGVIVDPMPDQVLANGQVADVLQVWVDPARRDAHRDPDVRAYLDHIARTHGLPAMVRWNSSDGVLVVAPCLTDGDAWLEIGGNASDDAGIAAARAAAMRRLSAATVP